MKTKLFSLLLAVAASVGTIFAVTIDGIAYNLNETELTAEVARSSYSGSIVIPSSVSYNAKTYSVTSIGSSAFSGCSGLTSVTIGNSVTSIGDHAFYKCTGLTSVTIGNSVTSIGSSAFVECTGLTSVTIGNSVTSIGDHAFYKCTGLTSVTIGNSVTSIGSSAFYKCTGLTSVTIGNSVTSIGSSAFSGCSSLTDIYVTCGDLDRVKQLLNNDNRVKYKPLPYSITVNATNGIVNYPQSSCDALELSAIANTGYHFTQWSDGNTDNPRSFVLTQDTTFTAEFAVDKNGKCGDDLALTWTYDSKEKALTISGKGTLNSNYTFGVEAPTLAEKLIIAEGVTTIGNSAFANYSALKHISIAASVKNIYERAFYNCTGLQEIYSYREKPSNAYSDTFDGIDKSECTLHVLSSAVELYGKATGWRDFYLVETIDAEKVTEEITDVKVEPTENAAEVTWPVEEQAATYTLQISRDGVVFCTLIFNANGQLQGIAFVPGRDGNQVPAAVLTANGGLRFTVTGLDNGTAYSLALTAKDAEDKDLKTYSANFETTGASSPAALDQVTNDQSLTTHKVFRNGQVLILRGNKTFNASGVRVK